MSYCVHSSGSFNYIDEGEGEVLVLLHGLFGNLAHFEHTIAHFSRNYRTIAPLLPIYQLPISETSVPGMFRYFEQLVEELSLEQFILVGNSLGGHIALNYALVHPEKVSALILTGSSGLFEKAYGESIPRRGDYDYIRQKTQKTFFNPALATKEVVDEIFNIVNDREKALRVVSVAKSAIRSNVSEFLKEIVQPVLLIWGKNDTITPSFIAEEFHKLIPHSELKWIDNCGHAAMMEQPKIFNELLDGFLRSLKQLA